MEHSVVFDTYSYVKRLKAVGFTEEQAAVQAETIKDLTIKDLIDDKLSTKRDLKDLELALKRDLKELETSMKRDLKGLETSTKRDLKGLELRLKHDLTVRFGIMISASVAAIAAIVKLA
jgi:predicted phage-related endonuclease